MAKIDRSAFLYMTPRGKAAKFAQCESCRLFLPQSVRCAVLDTKVYPDSSCGLFVWGQPKEDQEVKRSATPQEAGLVHAHVRCENCASFDGRSRCRLYEKLNKALGDIFELDDSVRPMACCNGWNQKARRNRS